jgi:F420-dependent oxidoreductase-like protein
LKEDKGLEFGLTIPQGWRGGDLPLEEENDPIKQYGFSKSVSIEADGLGFSSIYAYDHLIPFRSGDRNKNIFECFTLLSSLAAITERINLGQIVTCSSYRKPALLAKMLSTLDVISNGRLELGIGAGWYEQEYKAYGYYFPSDISRIKELDESLRIIKAMWTEEPYATIEGKYHRIREAICNPKPIQRPHPIIMVGGSGEEYLLKVVAKYADRYNLFFGSPDRMIRKISVLKEHCNSIGRDYAEIQHSIVLPCIIKDTEEKVDQVLVQYRKKDKTMEEYIQYLVGGIAVGTPEKVLQGIKKYVDIGVTHFILHFIGLDDVTLRLFDAKVIRCV